VRDLAWVGQRRFFTNGISLNAIGIVEHMRPVIVCLLMIVCWACAKPAPEPVVPASPAVVKPGTTISANPDPIVTDDGSPLGETSITWSTNAKRVVWRIGKPDGQLFGGGGSSGTVHTGVWVTNGMTFYLQDGDAPDPTSAAATLGSIAISVQ
jgi:hypothetical protein